MQTRMDIRLREDAAQGTEIVMHPDQRIFYEDDHDAPTTPALRRRLADAGRLLRGSRGQASGPGERCVLCGCSLAADPEADRRIHACSSCKTRPEARPLRGPQPIRSFTDAERSLIRKVHGYVPPRQLLGILNDRLRGDLGPAAAPYTMDQLHAEIGAAQGTGAARQHGWAGLRKLLADADRAGTLSRIDERVITDFAVVFSLSPKQLMQLKDVLLQPVED